MSIGDNWDFGMTEKQVRLGHHIDKVWKFHETALEAYRHCQFAKATNILCRLRDHLDGLDLPRKAIESQKPKRNIELYDNQIDAWNAFKKEKCWAYFDMASYVAFVDWLFATAVSKRKETKKNGIPMV